MGFSAWVRLGFKEALAVEVENLMVRRERRGRLFREIGGE